MLRYLKPLPGWLLWASVAFFTGCGGGSGTSQTPSNPEGSDPTRFALTSEQIPDATLRACINELAQQQQWSAVEDVSYIQCDDMEIRSIAGLLQFPNLHELKISAPHFDIRELPILAALPLADYEYQPYYNGDSSNANNVQLAFKQMLMQDSVVVPTEEAVTLILVTANDPANQPETVSWFPHSGDAPLAQGQITLSSHLTLHWAQFDSDTVRTFDILAYAPGDFEIDNSDLILPRFVMPDQPLSELNIHEDVAACLDHAIEQYNWTHTWQVTSLDCSDYPINEVYLPGALPSFPQLRSLTLAPNSVLNIEMMLVPPYFQSLIAPGLIPTDLHLLEQQPWSVVPAPVAGLLTTPRLSIQPCGIRIDKYDPDATYSVTPISNNDISVSNARLYYNDPVDWNGGDSPDCMALQGDFAWRIVTRKDGYSRVANNVPVTNAQGDVLQMIYEDELGPHGMSVPGQFGDSYWIMRWDGDFHLEQYDLETWALIREIITDHHPLYATTNGVYLVEHPTAQKMDSDRTWFLDVDGHIDELPTRPVAAIPYQVLEYDGEIWFYNLKDNWGKRPEALIWNPQTQQWRTLPMNWAGTFYKLAVIDNQLCVDSGDPEIHCLQENGQTWLAATLLQPVYNGMTQYQYLASTQQWLSVENGLQPILPLYGYTDIFSMADPISLGPYPRYGKIDTLYLFSHFDIDFEARPFPLLDNTNPAAPEYIGPMLPTIPIRGNYRITSDTLYMLFNDSIARYPLPEQ